MPGWDAARNMSWSGRVAIAAGVFAVTVVAAVPVVFVISVFMMLLGHVVGGLALLGASVLAAVAAIAIAALTGGRHLREIVRQQARRIVQVSPDDYDVD